MMCIFFSRNEAQSYHTRVTIIIEGEKIRIATTIWNRLLIEYDLIISFYQVEFNQVLFSIDSHTDER
jgi:hypothetical protein